LQYEATWSLTNIASGATHQVATVVDGGAIPHFIRLLHSPSIDVVEQSAWALGNIAGDSLEYRDLVIASGALARFASLESKGSLAILRNVSWAISNLCRGKPSPPLEEIVPVFPFLLNRLIGEDDESRLDACFAISYFSDGEKDRVQDVLDANLLPPIVAMLAPQPSRALDQASQTAALRVVGNILTGDENQTQAVLDLGILPIFSLLLESPKNSVKKETCWALSNITAGTTSQLQMVIDAEIFPKIFELGMSSNNEISKECLWCIANSTQQKNLAQVGYLRGQGLLLYLAWCLQSVETQTLYVVLSAIDNLLNTDKSFHEIIAVAIGARLEDLAISPPSSLATLLETIITTLQGDLVEWRSQDGNEGTVS
jgi:importin subunit alpha-6/7